MDEIITDAQVVIDNDDREIPDHQNENNSPVHQSGVQKATELNKTVW